MMFLLSSALAALLGGSRIPLQSTVPNSSPSVNMVAPPKDAPFDKAEFDQAVMGTYNRFQMAVERGEGCWLWDLEGKKYLDFAAGISTCCLGHANEELAVAVAAQMRKVNHVSNLYYIPQQGELAKALVKTCCADKVFFCNSGAEANEAAIKLARKHAHTKLADGKEILPVIITAKNSFHGRTLATITATGQPKYQQNFGPLPEGFEYATYNNVDELRELVASITGNDKKQLAAIMMEPLQGEGGITPATTDFFAAARKICDETGALLMADEVQTGMGRTGLMWGYQHHGVDVDVITSAKALGGGVPIGAMMCRESANVFVPGDHASTYGGNPLACAAGLEVMAAFEQRGLLENVQARGAELRAGLDALAERKPELVREVRGWGLIMGVELTEECGFSASDVCASLTARGMLTVPAGLKVLRLVPPLVVNAEEIELSLKMLSETLDELEKK